MAYSELIKDFNRIRDYMRQFYVYGFKTRDEYDAKSARSYDNERRRIESWLGGYMSFRQEPSRKVSFITVDSARIEANPLYNAFKTSSFTANDIVLNFVILDILQPEVKLSTSEITEIIDEDYMSEFDDPKLIDEATVRNKLNEYVDMGILTTEKDGRKMLYSRSEDDIPLDDWQDAVAFCSEVDPVGVIGSYILDKFTVLPGDPGVPIFSYKHHYILHALESDIICIILDAICDDCYVELSLSNRRKDEIRSCRVIPFKICMSTESGRGYLLGREPENDRFNMYRLDRIESVEKGEFAPEKSVLACEVDEFTQYLWNASSGKDNGIARLEMTLHIGPDEMFVLQRLKREGKHGCIEELGDDRFRYKIDVYDPLEMHPWIRTFIGRIEELTCTDTEVVDAFYRDLAALENMYLGDYGASEGEHTEEGGGGDAV